MDAAAGLQPLSEQQALQDHGGVRLEIAGPERARRRLWLAAQENWPADICGLSVLPGATELDFLLARTAQGAALYLAEALVCRGALLHMRPLDAEEQDFGTGLGGDKWHLDACELARHVFGGGTYLGPLTLPAFPPEPQLLTVLHPVRDDGAADFFEPLLLESGLWEYDRETQTHVLVTTGTEVRGRQFFPDFYSPQPGLAVGRPADLANARELVRTGKARGVPLVRPPSPASAGPGPGGL